MSENMWLEELVQFAIDDRTDWIFVKDKQHRYLLVNAEFSASLNHHPKDMVGRLDTDFWPEEMCLGNAQKGWRGFHHDENTVLSGETLSHAHDCILLPDGTEHFFDTFYTPLRSKDGNVYAVLGRWRNVTSPKEIIQVLRESEKRLRALIDASPDLIIFKDGKGRWLVANQACLTMYGFIDKYWQGRTDAELAAILPPPLKEALLRCMESDEEVWRAGKLTLSEISIAQLDGGQVVLHVSKMPLFEKDGNRKALVVLNKDMTAYVNAEQQLREKHAFLESILQGVNLPTFIVDADHTVLVWNRALEEMTGIMAADIVGTREAWRGFYPSPRPCLADLMVDHRHDAVNDYYNTYAKAEYSSGAFRAEAWFEIQGKRRYLSFEATPIHNAAGNRIAAIETLYDITNHIQVLEQLHLASEVFANSHEAIIVTDAENNILTVNLTFTEITGYTAEEVIGRNPRLLSSGRHDKAFYQNMWKCIETNNFWQGEIWDRRKDGEIYPKWLSISAVRNSQGKLTHYVAIFFDLTERNASESMVQFLTYYDPLTQLPNRVMLRDHCTQMLATAQRNQTMVALLVLDLDAFKQINDNLGHVIGDRLLQEAAKRFTKCMRKMDIIGRLGGDEFILLLTEVASIDAVGLLAQRILDCFAEPIAINGHRLDTTLSIGIGIFPDDGGDFDTLLSKADAAMYVAKECGRNTYRFYAGHMSDNALERLQLRNHLSQAIKKGCTEFVLHYQPQFDLQSGLPIGVEALLRWNSPRFGKVSPANFIPVAEESGLIVPLGAWAMREACRQNRAWQMAGYNPVVVAVNLSVLQFRRGDIAQTVADVLRETNLAPEWLELELTESILIHNVEHVLEVVGKLKKIGVRLSIDDFGTGYSSLSYLKRFKVDKLKIDQSFVRNLATDEDDAAIVQSVIQLGHSMKLKIIAEGVETQQQLEYLRRKGCDEIQGYLYSRPLPAKKIVKFLKIPVETPLSGNELSL